VIRDFEDRDAAAVSAGLHEEDPPIPVTPAGVLHWNHAQPERARARLWVAEEDERIVGWAEARIRWSTSVPDVGDLWAYVVPTARGRGLGASLYAETERHLRSIGASKLESWTYTDAGRSLLERRGFRATGHERISVLDLASADTSALAPLAEALSGEGFRLVPLGEVVDRVEELHRLYAEASADIPEYFKEDDVRLDDWRRETLEHPQLTAEGSFIALAPDGVPAALALLELDEPARIAANELTGTLVAYRRRGLARLVKLATIRWAKEHGFERIFTGNAEVNEAMLGLNMSLGYEPIDRETHYVREDVGRASPLS
jgi:GNAT superfamily N-acetyltransferase